MCDGAQKNELDRSAKRLRVTDAKVKGVIDLACIATVLYSVSVLGTCWIQSAMPQGASRFMLMLTLRRHVL
jgi:hypothetical protein